MCGLLVVYYFKHAVREMKVSIEMGYYIAYIKCSMHNTEEIVQKVNLKKVLYSFKIAKSQCCSILLLNI